MGDYEEHLHYGYSSYILYFASVAVTVATTPISFLTGVLLSVIGFPIVIIGAIFPDTDHHASKPHQMLKKLMFFVGIIGSFYFFSVQSFLPIQELIAEINTPLSAENQFYIAILLVSLLIGLLSRQSVVWFRPKHRGITHRLPTGIVLSTSLIGVFWYVSYTLQYSYSSVIGLLLGSAFFIGFLSHLHCDELLYSFSFRD